ncbi:MAG TPA: hypothetical protein VG889_05290 [Rhizomicrobium sp.]|nr:hypothetical protein [Rhizomicrobium sp.]
MRLLDLVSARPIFGKAELPVLIVNGHPDPRPERFCAALARAYRDGARACGREAEILTLGALQDQAAWSDAAERLHDGAEFVAIFPLWLDRVPPMLARLADEAAPTRCSDAIVTMAMPAFAYRSGPACRDLLPAGAFERTTFIGSVDAISAAQRESWLAQVERLGRGRRRL